MLKYFQNFIKEENLFSEHDKILVAVSGGIDSVALCQLMHDSGYSFGIAHCNFQLRGDESDGDEKFVNQLAKDFGVNFHVKKFETKKYSEENNISIQMAARELRYSWFEEIRDKNKYNSIAVAHHLDDETETFFINLIRGTGIAGLHGIKPKTGNIIRPLLFTNRAEVEMYINKKKIKFREDSSNSSDKYLRNKIRHQLIPLLKEMNPDIKDSLSSTIARIGKIENIFNEVVENEKRKIVTKEESLIKLDIKAILKLNEKEIYLYEFLKPYGFNGDMVAKIVSKLNSESGKIFLSPSHKLVKDRKYLLVTSLDNIAKQNNYKITAKTKSLTVPIKLKFFVSEINKNFKIQNNKNIATLDFDKLNFPLTLRTWKIGDFFYPLGMKSKKKLSNFFTDKKLSLFEKEKTWLLCNGEEIAWIVGYRIDNRYKVTEKTKKILNIDFDNK